MRIGIVGNGLIVNMLLEMMPRIEGVSATALCVRPQSEGKGRAIADKYAIPVLYTDYAAFLREAACDAVYIGVTNDMHYQYTKQALEAGHHVILEKPFTETPRQARALVALARQKKRLLLEAVTSLYSPIAAFLREHIGSIGDIKLVQANYSQYSRRYDQYLAGEVLPVFDPLRSGGALFDVNVYNLHAVVDLFGAPAGVRYFANLGPNGVDTSGTAVLCYPGFVAHCTAAKDSESPGYFIIQGTRGHLHVPQSINFSASATLHAGEQTAHASDPRARGHRMADEFEAFARIWRDSDWPACERAMDHTLRVMDVLEAARCDGGMTPPPERM